MKKLFTLVIIISFMHSPLCAQVGIGTPTPDASAVLDVKNPNKGFLLPRVALTGTGDATTIPSPATSLLVYNTTAAGVGETAVIAGFYYWNGSAWVLLNTGALEPLATTAWLLTGNAGTIDGTNFIGTTDNVPFNIRVNNQPAGRIDPSLLNTFWGYKAGNANTTGNSNTATGWEALLLNTTGSNNTATGFRTLRFNTTGSDNTAFGYAAFKDNTTGSNNTATGRSALVRNDSGNDNAAYGNSTLSFNVTGNNNTAFGSLALLTNKYGSNNTALGNYADVGAEDLTNATAIGSGAIVNASNKIRLGNTAVTVIEGQVAYSFPSDKRFKYDIKKDVPGLAFIKKLTPVTYYFDEQKLEDFTKTGLLAQGDDNNATYASYTGNKQLHTGFVAQDVEKVAKELGYNFDGVHAPANDNDHYSLAYSQFIMPLVKGMQEQQQIIEEQSKKIKTGELELQKMNEKIAVLTKLVEALSHK